jgi:branched-chain amino acid transport system substrate-binding protein
MSRQACLRSFCILAAFIVLVGIPAMGQSAEKEVRIGITLPLTGPSASMGQYKKIAYEMAAEEINAAGGIKSLGGAKLKIFFGDHQMKNDIAMAEQEKLIQQGMHVMIGSYASGVTLVTTQVSERYKIPHVTAAPVADEITQRGYKYTFQVDQNSTGMARTIVRAAMTVGKYHGKLPKTAVLLHEDTLGGQTMGNAWTKCVPEEGLKLLGRVTYPTRTTDVTTEMMKIKALKPDIILGMSYLSDALLIRRTMHKLKLNVMGYFDMGATNGPEYITALGYLADYVFPSEGCSPYQNLAGSFERGEKYKKRAKADLMGPAGLGYSSVFIVKDALERAASLDPEKIRDALSKTKIKAGEKGVLLPWDVQFDDKGYDFPAEILVCQILKNRRNPVYPIKFASMQAIWPTPTWEERKL